MEFRLPELGEGVHEGELVSWKVKVGDQIQHDRPLCEVMTDKATVEIPAPFDGKVAQLHAREGETIKVDQLLVTYEGKAVAGASKAPAMAAAQPVIQKSIAEKKPVASSAALPVTSVQASASAVMAMRVAAAPTTRKLARERGIEIAAVPGSGPGGRVLKEDIERFASPGAVSPTRSVPTGVSKAAGGETRVAFKGLRRKIAEKMRESKDKAAHFTYVEEADATRLVKLRDRAKEIGARKAVKVTYLPFVMKAMVAALREFPVLNSTLDEATGELVYKHFYNIGLSVQTEDGLIAPVIKGVEYLSILELAKKIQDVVDRARNKKLTLDDLTGGTITLTNAGSIGGLFATPVINYPEVAILGFNKIFKKPVVVTRNGVDRIAIRNWTYFSISLDHRIVDGAVGAEFMKLLISYIEDPSLLLMDSF